MISVHNRAAQTFTATGLAVLDREIIDPVVSEELGSHFMLSFSYPADGSAAKHLRLENIVATPVPGVEDRQGFRIAEVVTTLGGILEVTAHHVFYDLSANLVSDTYVVNKTAADALKQLLDAANSKHGFTASSSDTSTRASARIVRQSLAAAILDSKADNSFVSRWGGELAFDNWHIHHAPRRGRDAGVVIRDRKNLSGYESSLDYTTIVTRILPVGYDGLLLPELYVDSPRISDYIAPRIKVIRYGQVKAIKDPGKPREDELPLEQAHARLRELANAEFSSCHVDQPHCAYKISFVDLASTKEYEGFCDLETVTLGDTVTVRHDDLNVALTARVVAYDFDPLAGEYISIELGSTAPKFTDITHTVTAARSEAIQAQQAASIALASADGKNTNHYGTTQPVSARLGDVWFKDNGEQVGIWIYKLTDTGQPGWVSLATDLNGAELAANLQAAKTQIARANASVEQVQASLKQTQGELVKTSSDTATAKAQAEKALQDATSTQNALEAFKVQVADETKNINSSLTMVSDNVNLRVKRAEIITQINLSNETVLIDAAKVHISGQTSIDDAVIGTAMIADAAITNAKIGQLSADKITTGTLASARIAAGSITSDKLTIANGYIQTAMISDAAITSAKIAYIDASKITTGLLDANRIGAASITADKLSANAIQVGLAGWTSNIRINPTQISWYNGSELEGKIASTGMQFWYGNRYIGQLGRGHKKDHEEIEGISTSLANEGDYVAWTYQDAPNGDYFTCLTLDPKGRFYDSAGIHLGADLRTNGYKFYTTENRSVTLEDCVLTDRGTHPGWVGPTKLAKVVFHTYDVMIVTNGTFYNMTRLFDRLSDLMIRVNGLIGLLNQGWISTITSKADGTISWTYFHNTGYQPMSTNTA
ncbi:peptidase [Mobiluncus curtisii]|uniref:phage tail spike protein n=1 Tax=Mobiluncus curtisii TaxID=2051 RepID=UPI0014703FCF|nr:phage tail spike protein [Mobiluncus curtisii]NMW84027.1 peptidase [Mobiluncus curtisii]NMW99012.1 peptidase [Mobiluncus curtisii]